jgi:hypothetical protein
LPRCFTQTKFCGEPLWRSGRVMRKFGMFYKFWYIVPWKNLATLVGGIIFHWYLKVNCGAIGIFFVMRTSPMKKYLVTQSKRYLCTNKKWYCDFLSTSDLPKSELSNDLSSTYWFSTF